MAFDSDQQEYLLQARQMQALSFAVHTPRRASARRSSMWPGLLAEPAEPVPSGREFAALDRR